MHIFHMYVIYEQPIYMCVYTCFCFCIRICVCIFHVDSIYICIYIYIYNNLVDIPYIYNLYNLSVIYTKCA